MVATSKTTKYSLRNYFKDTDIVTFILKPYLFDMFNVAKQCFSKLSNFWFAWV